MTSERIAVVGGTGMVGRHVVERVRARGLDPVVVARSTGIDLAAAGADQAVARALRGCTAVIDVSNVTTMSRRRSVAFFERVTTALLAAEAAAGVERHVLLSIVGTDRVDLGYYLGKRHQEQLVLRSARPVTVLRATQFHEFAGQVLDRSTVPGLPMVLVPRMLSAPVAAREVAEHLVDAALAPAVGLAPELAGPQTLSMVDLVRRVARARGLRRPVLGVALPGAVARAVATGALLPTGPGLRGRETFEEWLDGAGSPAAEEVS